MNCGDIAPDDADVDGRNGADDGVDPGAECDVGSSSGLLFKLNAWFAFSFLPYIHGCIFLNFWEWGGWKVKDKS